MQSKTTMHQQQFQNPKIPFTGPVKGLQEGTQVTVKGRVLPGAERFKVNFQQGSDVALHFNPRYGFFTYVVCNTLQGTRWGWEERKSPTPLPRGSTFTIVFLVNHDAYSIIVNGEHFTEYKHRIPASGVDNIVVDGGVEIYSIVFQDPAPVRKTHSHSRSRRGGNPKWSNQPAVQQCSFPFQMAPPPYSSSLQSCTVPYKAVIQGGFYPGKNVIIQGTPNFDADRFCINLRFNTGIALHFNPRFGENSVVRNSHLNNGWGLEERSGGMPFHRGQPFGVTVICDTQCYRILVNGIQMFTYNHRFFSHEQTDIIEVTGDVSLTSVQV